MVSIVSVVPQPQINQSIHQLHLKNSNGKCRNLSLWHYDDFKYFTIVTILTHWILLQNINSAQLSTGTLFKLMVLCSYSDQCCNGKIRIRPARIQHFQQNFVQFSTTNTSGICMSYWV